MNEGSLIRVSHVLLTEVDLTRSFTGSLKRISMIVSGGRSSNDVADIFLLEREELSFEHEREKLSFEYKIQQRALCIYVCISIGCVHVYADQMKFEII